MKAKIIPKFLKLILDSKEKKIDFPIIILNLYYFIK